MTIVRRCEQRRPAVLGDLIDVRAFIQQQLRRFEIAFARGQCERREPSATGSDSFADARNRVSAHLVVDGGTT